jgi:hypothetical protein
MHSGNHEADREAEEYQARYEESPDRCDICGEELPPSPTYPPVRICTRRLCVLTAWADAQGLVSIRPWPDAPDVLYAWNPATRADVNFSISWDLDRCASELAEHRVAFAGRVA